MKLRKVLMKLLIFALPLLALAGLPGNAAEKEQPKQASEQMAGRVTLKEALSDKVLGKKDAPITILAFESLTCPHCASFHRNTLPQLKKEYIETGKAKLVFVDYPLDGRAMLAAMLARCSGDERFFAIIEMLFGSQQTWARAKDVMGELGRIGRFGGMTKDEFKSCMANKALFDGIRKRQLAADKEHNIRSTPTFVINGKKLLGALPFADFDKLMKPMVK